MFTQQVVLSSYIELMQDPVTACVHPGEQHRSKGQHVLA